MGAVIRYNILPGRATSPGRRSVRSPAEAGGYARDAQLGMVFGFERPGRGSRAVDSEGRRCRAVRRHVRPGSEAGNAGQLQDAQH